MQRGTPAWTDKYLRTQIALECGADMVFELPTAYATASAKDFAFGGVSLLQGLGFVDTLCFGSECGDIHALWNAAQFLANPGEAFETTIRELVGQWGYLSGCQSTGICDACSNRRYSTSSTTQTGTAHSTM